MTINKNEIWHFQINVKIMNVCELCIDKYLELKKKQKQKSIHEQTILPSHVWTVHLGHENQSNEFCRCIIEIDKNKNNVHEIY